MFNITPGELLVIAVVLLVVVGPEQLPSVVKKIRDGARQIKQVSSSFNDEFMRALDVDSTKPGNSKPKTPSSKMDQQAEASAVSPNFEEGETESTAFDSVEEVAVNEELEVVESSDDTSGERTDKKPMDVDGSEGVS